jgi:hypothetical protein
MREPCRLDAHAAGTVLPAGAQAHCAFPFGQRALATPLAPAACTCAVAATAMGTQVSGKGPSIERKIFVVSALGTLVHLVFSMMSR